MQRTLAARLAATVLTGGVIALAPIVAPAADAATPAQCPGYRVQTTTSTSLSTSPANPARGTSFTATASVSAAGVPVQGGTVTFRFIGQSTTVSVVAGTASASFTVPNRPGRYPLSARYTGQCLGDAIAIGTSSGGVVLGVEATRSRPPTNGGVSGVSGGVSGSSAGSGISGVSDTSTGLGGTGVDPQTELYGLLGVSLVVVGGLTMVVRRRRIDG